MNNFLNGKSAAMMLALSLVNVTAAFAQDDNSSAKEEGYCDFFLLPDLTHYASQHSYILELKVLSKKDFSAIVEGELTEDGKPMTKAEKQWREAVDQIHRYAEAPRVEALRQGTKLHLIIMQFEGWELKRMEEV